MDEIQLGKRGKLGNLNLNNIKSGIKKEDITGGDKKLDSIFDSVDDGNNVLDRSELQKLYEKLAELAGDDLKLSKREAGGFTNAEGKKLGIKGRKALFEFLNRLSNSSKDVKSIQTENINGQDVEVVTYYDNRKEEIYPDGTKVTTTQNGNKTTITREDKDGKTISKTETTEENGVTTVVEYEGEAPESKTVIDAKNSTISTYTYEGGTEILQKEENTQTGDITTYKDGVPTITRKDVTGIDSKDGNPVTTTSYTNPGSEEASTAVPEKLTTADVLQNLFGDRKKASVKIDGSLTGLSNGAYQGEVILPSTETLKDGAFPENLSITLPAAYGQNATMKLKLLDPENGIYESSAKDRNFRIAADENGNITIKSVNVEELTGKLNANLAEYAKIEAQQKAAAAAAAEAAAAEAEELTAQTTAAATETSAIQQEQVKSGASAQNDAAVVETRTQKTPRPALTGNGISFIINDDGSVEYFDKDGKPVTGEQREQLVKAESQKTAGVIYEAANIFFGTDEEKLSEGVNMIYSSEIMDEVNNILKKKDRDYKGDENTTPLEALLLDELSRSEVRSHIKTLAANGAYGTGQKKDEALGRNAAREIKYEVHGGVFGYTGTADLKEAMSLASTRGARLATEEYFKNGEVKGDANNGSMIRAYIAEDGWNAQEVDQFDATWVKNNAYDTEHEQAHRNGVIGRLVFEHDSDEALHIGLDSVNDDPESADYQELTRRAAEENDSNGYKARFDGQEAVQTYIAGRTQNKDGTVDTEHVSACNTLLYKGAKPVRVQAEENLYNAQKDDMSGMFDSMEPEVYTEMSDLLAKGNVEGCTSIQEAYDKALESTGEYDLNEKAKIKANAILSGQIEFSDEEVTDFCVELMHRIDRNRGAGTSTGKSAGFSNIADYETEQLKAILQSRPQILQAVKERVEQEDFSYSTTLSTHSEAASIVKFETNTKEDYLAIINDSKYTANEAVFYDAEGNQITDPGEIKMLTEENMSALNDMREYVAQLERDFKKGVDAEGGFSDLANGISTYSGLGTDRSDVENEYRNAKLLLNQLEAAAQGKLRDSEGNVISVQDLAQTVIDKENELAKTNAKYDSTIEMTKMGIILAPVIAATTVATLGTSIGIAGATTATLGTSAGFWTSAGVAGVTTAAAEYGLNTIERATSITGDTAEAREEHAASALIDGASTFIGAGQMKFIPKLLNNAGAFVRGGGRLVTVAASDIGVGAAGEYVQTGTVTVNGVAMNAVFSVTGNLIGVKSLAKKGDVDASNLNAGKIEVSKNANLASEANINQLKGFSEAQIGESGFLSYRYDAGYSKQYKPDNIEDPYLKMMSEKNNVSADNSSTTGSQPEDVSANAAQEQPQTVPAELADDEIPVLEVSLSEGIQMKLNASPAFADKLAAKIDAKPEIAEQLKEIVLKSGKFPLVSEKLVDMATPDNIDALVKLSKNKNFEFIDSNRQVDEEYFKTVLDIVDKNPQYKDAIIDVAANSARSADEIMQIAQLMHQYPDKISEIAQLTKSNVNIKVSNTENIPSTHVADIVTYLDSNPEYHDEIIDFMSVQRKAANDTRNPAEELGTYLRTLEENPKLKNQIERLAQNPNISPADISSLITEYKNDPQKLNDAIALSNKKYTENAISRNLENFDKYPELRSIMLSDSPSFRFIDKNPEGTPVSTLQKRFETRSRVEDAAPEEVAGLKQTLESSTDNYYQKIQWEEIIPANASDSEIREIVTQLNKESKFFARTFSNEANYGKNIQWAHEINNISESAALRITKGESCEEVLNNIAADYRAYDQAGTLDSNTKPSARRKESGLPRMAENGGWPYATTPVRNYPEYIDRLEAMNNKIRTYKGIELTDIGLSPYNDNTDLYMLHPKRKNIPPAMKEINKCYDKLQPLVQKVQNGGTLTASELEFVDDQMAEMYYLLANVMPWNRGSNGISDIFMRSVYESLGIDRPALKQGVSLDLEAFCCNMNDYKANWNSFFETPAAKPVRKTYAS